MDSKPAAIIDPMKTSHLSNPFNKDAFLETLDLLVIAELNLIGQGTPQTIESSIPTQTIVDRTAPEFQSDIMTHLVTDLNQMSLKSKYFPFHKKEASTLMFAPFFEAFLTGNRHIHTTGIVGTCRDDHSRIIPPRMYEDILHGNDVATTVRSDIGVMKKLNTTVDRLTTNKRNTESTDIFEGAAESVFGKNSEQFDSSGRLNFAKSVPVESPDLVSFRDLPVQTHNVTDGGTGGVATSIADKDRICRVGPSDICAFVWS